MQAPSDSPPRASFPALWLDGPTRVAVVGTGYIAEYHLDVLAALPEVRVVAVCDVERAKAEAVARRRGIASALASVRELAALPAGERPQIAHVTAPPALHGALTRELLDLGIGCFVEKPLVLSSAEARELAALAESKGVPLAVNHNACWHPAFARLQLEVFLGRIGRVEHVRACLSVPLRQLDAGDFSHWMFRAPENIVFEQAPHPCAQIHQLVGRVKRCQTTLLASRELQPGQTFHSKWLVAAEAERGTVELYLAFGESFTRSTIEVLGSDGSLEADLHHNHWAAEDKTPWLDFWNSFLAGWRRGAMLRRSARRGLSAYLKQTLRLAGREDAFYVGMRDSITAFHAELRDREPFPGSAEDAAAVLEWCEAIARPAVEQRRAAPGAPGALPAPGTARRGEIVLLGATGFIGQRVLARLLERRLPVTVVARRAHSLPAGLAAAIADGRVRFFRGALSDREALALAIDGAATVLHLATGGGATWEEVEKTMVQGSRSIGELCLERGARLVFVSSTAALYLGRDCGTARVADDRPADDRPLARPPYARGKVATEGGLRELAARGLRLTIARPGVVLGRGTPMQHSGIGLWVRDNHCVGWGLGQRPLPLVLADDVADALAALAAYPARDLDGQALNLCARTGISAAEMVAAFARASGRKLSFHPRRLELSQTAEIGKWLVKKAGGRRDAFPSWRDLKSRELWPEFSCELARAKLGWKPCEERAEFLRRATEGLGRATEGLARAGHSQGA